MVFERDDEASWLDHLKPVEGFGGAPARAA
jgi:hypothetical protein